MSEGMRNFYYSLIRVSVSNVAAAIEYVNDNIKFMEMNGDLSYEITYHAINNLKKDIKKLKKIYKGKIDQNPETLQDQYDENSHEHYFLKCVLAIMKNQ